MGGPCKSTSYGEPARIVTGSKGQAIPVEGYIWSATPYSRGPSIPVTGVHSPTKVIRRSRELSSAGKPLCIRVTQKVVDQVNRQGPSAQQIAITGHTAARLGEIVTFRLNESEHKLIKRDTHAFWWSHQSSETLPSFEELFGMLADAPDTPHEVAI